MTVGRRSGRHTRRTRHRRSLTFTLGGAAVFCAAALAVAIGLGQAGNSPACASITAPPAQAALAAATQARSQTSGEATHYVLQSAEGNCSYPTPPADQLYVALPRPSTPAPPRAAATFVSPGQTDRSRSRSSISARTAGQAMSTSVRRHSRRSRRWPPALSRLAARSQHKLIPATGTVGTPGPAPSC